MKVRLWPLKHIRRGSGEGAFVHNDAFPEEGAGVLIRPVHFQAASSPPAPSADFQSYLEALIDRTSHISINGISSAGSVKGALRHPIEKLYTPLRSRGDLEDFRGLAGLPDLLPRHPRLLLEGQPGAGKTTFLRLVACLLARDILGIECPDGPSWRKLLWASTAKGASSAGSPPHQRSCSLADTGKRPDCATMTDAGSSISSKRCVRTMSTNSSGGLELPAREGEAILLLDGLDEVADEGLRARILEVFRDTAHTGIALSW